MGVLLAVDWNMDVQYTYSATQNNGQVTQSQDNVTGEQVAYQYDSLQRLVSASTVGPQWGLTFTYDGFGNRRSQQVTKGTAPAEYASYDSATNRINGYIHDGNGNITWLPNGTTLAYDVENRVATATVGGGVETYYYAPDGKRVYRKAADGTETMYFYGVKGERSPYQVGPYAGQLRGTPPVYFAGRRLGVATDRLGSVRVTSYYPYGEQETTTAEDDVRFATYVRDGATGLDYAVNRYYSSIIGRFVSPDPYKSNTGEPGDPADPGSWNRYAYVGNDPVNFHDLSGQNRVVSCGWILGEGGSEDSPGFRYSCGFISWSRGAGRGGGGGGGGGEASTLQVTRLQKSGADFDKVQNRLDDVVRDIDTDCLKFLQSKGNNLGSYVSDLLSNELLGVANFDTSIAAFTGSGGTSLSPGDAAIVINDGSAFFSSDFTIDQGKLTGGSARAQTFILLHELAHALNARDFQPDLNNKKAGKDNDKLIEQNCDKTLRQFSTR
ncbi:MAG: hypothetical protein LAN64_20510 [Acidobacteriia bacterium]|nr:hypothetical protein [Terriglobia bacterium]